MSIQQSIFNFFQNTVNTIKKVVNIASNHFGYGANYIQQYVVPSKSTNDWLSTDIQINRRPTAPSIEAQQLQLNDIRDDLYNNLAWLTNFRKEMSLDTTGNEANPSAQCEQSSSLKA